MGETRIESAVGPVDPPMTLPPGQEQELMTGRIGVCAGSEVLPPGQISMSVENVGVRMRQLGSDPPMTLPRGQDQELMSGGAGLSDNSVEVVRSGDVIPGDVEMGDSQFESLVVPVAGSSHDLAPRARSGVYFWSAGAV